MFSCANPNVMVLVGGAFRTQFDHEDTAFTRENKTSFISPSLHHHVKTNKMVVYEEGAIILYLGHELLSLCYCEKYLPVFMSYPFYGVPQQHSEWNKDHSS